MALLVAHGSTKDFAVRISVLTALEKCWSSGHSVLKMECSCDEVINCVDSVVVHEFAAASANHSQHDDTVADLNTKQHDDTIADSHSVAHSTMECLSAFNASDVITETSVAAADGSHYWICSLFLLRILWLCCEHISSV